MLQKSLMRLFQFLSKSNPPVPILPHNFQLLMLIEGGGGGGAQFSIIHAKPQHIHSWKSLSKLKFCVWNPLFPFTAI